MIRGVVLGSFLLFGLSLPLLHAALPEVIREFGWRYTATGGLLATGAGAYLLTAYAAGMVCQRFGPKRVLIGGLLCQAAGFGLFGVSPVLGHNMMLYALVGVGHGAVELAANYSIVQIERGGKTRLMNFMHAVFAVGAVATPLGVSAALATAAGWRLAFRALAGLFAVAGLSAAEVSFTGIERPVGPDRPRRTARPARLGLLILLFAMLLAYVGSEMGLSAWIAEYYVRVLGTTKPLAAKMVSLLWGGILVGRFAVAWLYHGRRHGLLLLGLTVTTAVAMPLAMVCRSALLAANLFFIAGLGYSAVYPTVISVVGRHFRRGQSMAIAMVSAGGGVGSLAGQFAIGAVADRFDLLAGLGVAAGLNVVMVLLAVGIIVAIRRPPRRVPRSHTDRNGQRAPTPSRQGR